MFPRRALSAFAACAALLVSSAASAQSPATARAEIGGVPFVLPVPADFTDPATTPKTLVDLTSHAVPAGNRLVALMIPATLLKQFADHDKTARMSRFVTVLSYGALDAAVMGQADFEKLKTTLRDQGPEVRKRAAEVAAEGRKGLSDEVARRNGGRAPDFGTIDDSTWGVFDEQPNSISMTVIQTSTHTDNAAAREHAQVIGMGVLRMHGKLLSVGVYSDFASAADVAWVKGQVNDWVKRVNELNP